MTTPLQTAAQQALSTLESGALLCEITAASMLRVALEAEQAQAVEVMKATPEDMLIYQKIAKQAQEIERMRKMYEQAQAVEPAIGCKCAVCGNWQRWTPSGMVCKLGHGGAPGINTKLYTHPAPPPVMHLSELIAEYQELNMANYTSDDVDKLNHWANRAYDMLEADAAHMALSNLAGNAETMSIANGMLLKLRAENKALKAQQVAVPMPMTTAEKSAAWVAATIELPSHINCYLRGIRDAEIAHGIGAKPCIPKKIED